jgi:hypothetical protein
LVWQQDRASRLLADSIDERIGNFSFGRDARALFRIRPDNIFLVKVNYWLNPYEVALKQALTTSRSWVPRPLSRRDAPIPVRAVVAALLLAPMSAGTQGQDRSSQRDTSGRLRSVVVEMGTEVPLAGAAIRLIAQDHSEVTRLTDDRGHASFTELVPGRYVIVIERLGYGEARASLNLRVSSLTTVTAELVPEVLELEPIIVSTTRRGADMGGFEERRRLGFGYFITRADLETNPSHVSSLLRTIPGVRVTPVIGLTRGGHLSMRGGCRPNLVLDGMPLRSLEGLAIDDYMTPNEVEAIEVYHGVEAPIRFGNSPCGVVVVWTRVPEPVRGGGSFWKRLLVTGGFMTIALLLTS